MKKELDSITKLSPQVRYDRLRTFLDRIKKQPETQQELDSWQMAFSEDVVKVGATYEGMNGWGVFGGFLLKLAISN